MAPIAVRRLGRTDYRATWEAMRRFTDARDPATPDEIWLTEHPPVYTLGLAGRSEHLLGGLPRSELRSPPPTGANALGRPGGIGCPRSELRSPPPTGANALGRPGGIHGHNGIEVIRVDRGGQVTYHGPGQLVAYALVDLRRAQLGIREMVRRLESAVVAWLAGHGIAAHGRVDAPGVYVALAEATAAVAAAALHDGDAAAVGRAARGRDEAHDDPAASAAFAHGEAKIAALGLKVRNHCTYHGLAVNVAMDLAPFADIDPCGYPGLTVVDLAGLGVRRTVEEAGGELAAHLVRSLARER